MRVTVSEEIRLDILTRQVMGTEREGAVEALLTANPGLAAQGTYVAEATSLQVPSPPAKPETPAINPWS